MPNKSEDKSRRPEDESTSLSLPGMDVLPFFDDFMRPFAQFMGPFFTSLPDPFLAESGLKQPTIDWQDRGDHYLMTAELPGFEKKDVEVRIDSNVLDLKAEKSYEEESKHKSGTTTKKTHSSYARRITLPEQVLAGKVNGTMKNGVLELKLPKLKPRLSEKSRRVDLK